jgi:predicted Zn-dependent peptidase
MLDRKTPPSFKPITKVNIPQIASETLSNGRKVYFRNDHAVEVFKIELVIQSGSWFTDQYNLIGLTLKMLNEGTTNKNAHELAEALDFIGSFSEFSPGFDQSSLSFYGLSKFFDKNVDLLAEIISSPRFDEAQFESLKKKEIQKLELNFEKGSYLSSVGLRAQLYSAAHPYGRQNTVSEIKAVSLDQVKGFFNSNFSDFDVFVTGKLPEDFLHILQAKFGESEIKRVTSHAINIASSAQKLIEVRKPTFIQSSIKVGKRLFNRTHPDYMKFTVSNELLGGFFGSRLMKNIREDKGFTYGIYSHLYSLNQDGYFNIGTEVNGENEQATLDEIFKDISKLQNEMVGSEELETVKNYMAGSFAGSLSSPFAIMDKFKAVHYQGMDMSFYENYLDNIYAVSSEDINEMMNKHLQPDSFYTFIAGPEKT